MRCIKTKYYKFLIVIIYILSVANSISGYTKLKRVFERGEIEVEFGIPAGGAEKVYIIGDFNSWLEPGTDMTKMGDGEWRASLRLPEGTYLYKFNVDGVMLPDPSSDEVINDTDRGYCSRLVLKLPEDVTRSIIVKKDEKGKSQINFSIFAGSAEKVYVSGDFNNWAFPGIPLMSKDNGLWETKLELKPGVYKYQFNVDGVKIPDPATMQTEKDIEHGYVSVIKIIDEDRSGGLKEKFEKEIDKLIGDYQEEKQEAKSKKQEIKTQETVPIQVAVKQQEEKVIKVEPKKELEQEKHLEKPEVKVIAKNKEEPVITVEKKEVKKEKDVKKEEEIILVESNKVKEQEKQTKEQEIVMKEEAASEKKRPEIEVIVEEKEKRPEKIDMPDLFIKEDKSDKVIGTHKEKEKIGSEVFVYESLRFEDDGVVFYYYDKDASEVYLTGDFVFWDPWQLKMDKSKEGVFTKKVAMQPGKYLYHFIVDKRWKKDPLNKMKGYDVYGLEHSLVAYTIMEKQEPRTRELGVGELRSLRVEETGGRRQEMGEEVPEIIKTERQNVLSGEIDLDILIEKAEELAGILEESIGLISENRSEFIEEKERKFDPFRPIFVYLHNIEFITRAPGWEMFNDVCRNTYKKTIKNIYYEKFDYVDTIDKADIIMRLIANIKELWCLLGVIAEYKGKEIVFTYKFEKSKMIESMEYIFEDVLKIVKDANK
ncbi:MAG: hypothetical protein AB1765_03305 [Candidatus Hydrogenedentota bacterium]